MTLKLENRSGEEQGIIVDPDDVWVVGFEADVRRGIEDYKAGKAPSATPEKKL